MNATLQHFFADCGLFLNVKVWMSVDSLSLFQKLIPKPDFTGDAKMFYSTLYWMYLKIKGDDFLSSMQKQQVVLCFQMKNNVYKTNWIHLFVEQ